ncbi:inner nuclear membrane protein Man1-like [Amphiura filiformis]|uniref:inner nuclear membrane protein Man1-like n=1 Tax=Amphiura filiformis TaxID=82378 RepID=UPI003B218404
MAAASNASDLSDSELRAELKRLGFNAGPVTGSTRPLLIKKLLKLQGDDKQLPNLTKKSVPSRKLLGFSSDESDSEHNGSLARSRNPATKNLRRRSTKAASRTAALDSPSTNNNDVPNSNSGKFNATPKPSQSSRASLGRSSLRGGTVSSPKSRVNSRARASDGSRSAAAEFSDSDVDIDQQPNGTMGEDEFQAADVGINTSNRVNSRASLGLGRHNKSGRASLNSTYALHDEDLNDEAPETQSVKPSYIVNKTPKTSTPRRTRSRLSDQTSTKKRNSSTVVPEDSHDSFVNRRYYPNASFTSMGGGDGSRSSKARSPLSAYEANHTGGGSVNQYGDGPIGGDTLLEKEFATEEKLGSTLGSKYGHSYIPMVLLMCAFLFFVSLAVMYFSVGALDRSADLKDERYLLCSSANPDKCLRAGDVTYANSVKIVEVLYAKLSEIAGMAECRQSAEGDKKNMTLREARIYLLSTFKSEQEDNPFWLDDHLKNVWEMIVHNEQWGLRLFGSNGLQLTNKTEGDLIHKVKYLDSTHLHMPWLCRVQRSAVLVLFRVCMIILAFLLAWLLFLYIRYWLRREEEEKAQVHQLVEKIIEMLSNHSRACSKDKSLPPYLAIPHVRDTLIPLAERRRKQKLWNRAVQFLNANESRVRVETQQVAGEEFPVWRWVQPSPVVISQTFAPITEQELNPNRVKVWQGTAFDNIDTAVKAPSYTPTPCLKIRNMFDLTLESGMNWHVSIEDAILEKCTGNDGIVHIAVDKNSREGCVYMKCATPENAGQAYRALQGSWFDGKLVTVKYLRLDRYHQRFPTAIDCKTPLQPSNNLKKSLSRPPHSSALESS